MITDVNKFASSSLQGMAKGISCGVIIKLASAWSFPARYNDLESVDLNIHAEAEGIIRKENVLRCPLMNLLSFLSNDVFNDTSQTLYIFRLI